MKLVNGVIENGGYLRRNDCIWKWLFWPGYQKAAENVEAKRSVASANGGVMAVVWRKHVALAKAYRNVHRRNIKGGNGNGGGSVIWLANGVGVNGVAK
jgi:hypothetical protein